MKWKALLAFKGTRDLKASHGKGKKHKHYKDYNSYDYSKRTQSHDSLGSSPSC